MAADRRRFRSEFYRRAVLAYPPRYVTIAIGSACTNRCVFCAYHSDDAKNGASNAYGLRYELSLEEFKWIVDMCYRGRVPKIHLCATGEPFLHRNILVFLDYAAGVYGRVSVQTNFHRPLFDKHGYLDEIVKRAGSISYMTTDVLSGDPETHERLKKGSSYEDVLSAMSYISSRSSIHFEVHYLLTKFNYQHIDKLIYDLSRRKINCHVAVVNLHPHGFNAFTAPEACYRSGDTHITDQLQRASVVGRERGLEVAVPDPVDEGEKRCAAFWSRFQIWPVKGVDEHRFGHNVVIGGCNAVVIGKLKSLGYISDYRNIMDLWNNERFVKIRRDLLRGVYPDELCRTCQNWSSGTTARPESSAVKVG